MWLDGAVAEYLAILAEEGPLQPGRAALQRLLLGREPKRSKERVWNWRSEPEIAQTLRNRGHSYNGYPVSAGYFGSYSLDAVALALASVRLTSSFDEAVAKAVNFLGDADTVGAIAGMLAGALYGVSSIDRRHRERLDRWDKGRFALRGALLHFAHGG